MSTSSPRRPSLRSTATSTSASRTPSSVCWRGRTRTARSACGRSAATIPGSTPTSPTSSRARASATSRCRRRRSRWRSTACAITSRNARPEQERRPRSRLCALRAGAQRRGAGRRPALHRRHQARRTRDADRQGANRRGARHARRQGARRPRLSRRAQRSFAAAQARSRPRRLRLGLARFGGAGDARLGRACAAKNHRRRGRARRCGARAVDPYLDAGGRLAGARRPRARQADQRHLACRQRRDAAGRVLPQPARRRTRRRRWR